MPYVRNHLQTARNLKWGRIGYVARTQREKKTGRPVKRWMDKISSFLFLLNKITKLPKRSGNGKGWEAPLPIASEGILDLEKSTIKIPDFEKSTF